MSTTSEISRDQWKQYFEQLSHRPELPVRIEVLGASMGDQILSERVLLQEISISRSGSGGSLEIALSVSDGDEWDHRILHPTRVYAVLSPIGKLECLGVEERGSDKTLIFFEPPIALPEREHADAR